MHLISDPVGLVAGHVGHFGAHLLHPLIDPGNLVPGIVVVEGEVVPWLWFPGTLQILISTPVLIMLVSLYWMNLLAHSAHLSLS